MTNAKPSTMIDVFVVHTQMEWQIARSIVVLLASWGYTVGASQRVDHPGCVARAQPGDARATIVVWPLDSGLCDMLKLEARAAAQRGTLVQIYAGRVRPGEAYAGPAPIDFTGWDYTRPGSRWESLIVRLTKLCGRPPSRPTDVNSLTQKGVLVATLAVTLGSIVTVLGQGGQDDPRIVTAPDPQLLTAPVAAPIVSVAEVEAAKRPGEDDVTLSGGSEDFYQEGLGEEEDLGIDVAKLPPANAPVSVAKRAPQGPEL